MKKMLESSYRNRFSLKVSGPRIQLWRTLNRYYFSKYIGKDDSVLDIACGKCEFLNTLTAREKIGIDLNPDSQASAGNGVTVLNIDVSKIPLKFNHKFDVVMVSNFLEHLPDKAAAYRLMQRVSKLLKNGGKVIILQPNINLVHERYWDFFDHTLAFNQRSVSELLAITGFKTEKYVYRFLPYTTVGSLPINPFLIRLYLLLPQYMKPFAGQSLFIAEKA